MDKKYNYQEFKKDPRTGKSRGIMVLFEYIDHNERNPEKILMAIDKAYTIGKHRSPSHIKEQKRNAIKLLNQFIPETLPIIVVQTR